MDDAEVLRIVDDYNRETRAEQDIYIQAIIDANAACDLAIAAVRRMCEIGLVPVRYRFLTATAEARARRNARLGFDPDEEVDT